MQALYLEIKNLIISTLNLDDLTPDDIDINAPLFGDGLGLDSIDALELGLAVKMSTASCSLRKAKKCVSTFLRRHSGLFHCCATCLRKTIMTDQQTIYQEVSALLVKLFEIDPQDIKPEARLYEDLELDSIDAVDMIVHLQKENR